MDSYTVCSSWSRAAAEDGGGGGEGIDDDDGKELGGLVSIVSCVGTGG